MEDFTLTRSLTILTRPSVAGEQESSHSRYPSLLSVEDISTSAGISTISSARPDPRQRRSPGLLSRPTTPPLDSSADASNQVQLISGIGDHFPTMLSRASSLTMGSECASNASAATPENSSEDSGDEHNVDGEQLVTPKVQQTVWVITPGETPKRTISTRDCIVVQLEPPVTPTPSPRRLKRHPDEPVTPCSPPKRRRAEVRRGQDSRPAKRHAQYKGGLPSHEAFQAAIVRRSLSLLDLVTSAPSGDPLILTPVSGTRSAYPDQNRVTIEIEMLGKDEIEDQLSALLSAYRQFYVVSNASGKELCEDEAAKGRAARYTLKTIFGDRLSSAEDEAFLLLEEEEDVMNTFMAWLRTFGLPHSAVEIERVPSFSAGLDWIEEMAAQNLPGGMKELWPFIRKISILPDAGTQFAFDDIPEMERFGRPNQGPEGSIFWEFENIASASQLETQELSDDEFVFLNEDSEAESEALLQEES